MAHGRAGQADAARHLGFERLVEAGAAKEAERGAHQRDRLGAFGRELGGKVDHPVDYLLVAARRDLAEAEPAREEAHTLAVERRAVGGHGAGARRNDQAEQW